MTQCCYKTHREDPQIFSKINAVSTSEGDSPGIFQCYRGNSMIFEIFLLFETFMPNIRFFTTVLRYFSVVE